MLRPWAMRVSLHVIRLRQRIVRASGLAPVLYSHDPHAPTHVMGMLTCGGKAMPASTAGR